MKGKLIVLTGIDGSGKTVQANLLYGRLKNEGIPVETIDFPQYGKTLFADLVARYLRGEFGKDVSPYLVAPLFAGDRLETKGILEKWLGEGKVVIANRYVCDNIAHQGVRVSDSGVCAKISEFGDWLTRLEHDIYGLPKSDLNILLSVPPAVAYELVAAKAERAYLEGKKRDIHEDDFYYLTNTSKSFHVLATTQPNWKIVECVDDCGTLLNEVVVSERVWDCVNKCLETSDISNKAVPAFKPGTMAALRVIDNWDGQRNLNYVLAEWCERDGEMQWCHWPDGGRVLDYRGDKILNIWILGEENAVPCHEWQQD